MNFETRIQAFLEQLDKVPVEPKAASLEQMRAAHLARFNARQKARYAYGQLSEADRQKLDALARSARSSHALPALLQRMRPGSANALRCSGEVLRRALERAKEEGVDLEAALPEGLHSPRPQHCGQVCARPAREPKDRPSTHAAASPFAQQRRPRTAPRA